MESFVTYSGRDLKLSQSINIDIFIYFHPLPVYASVKKFLLLFFILYFSISFNRPYFYWSLSSVRPAFIVDSRSRKFQVTNSTSANHFCAARSRCSCFETRRQKLDRIIGTERRCFPVWLLFFSPLLSTVVPEQFRGWFYTILKKIIPFYRQLGRSFHGFYRL